ncbi:MAG: phage holin family protein, partial [Sporomusaceae bacterium]|nr:phage holin family protein [Sporomusaceae bacterium]
LPGIFVDTLGGLLLGVAIIGIANAAVRPILTFTARPLDWLNLGGVTFCLNIITPLMVMKTLPGFQINSITAPVIGVFFITIFSSTLSKMIHDR